MTNKEKPTDAGRRGGLQNLPVQTSLINILTNVVGFNLPCRTALQLDGWCAEWRSQAQPDHFTDPVVKMAGALWDRILADQIKWAAVHPPARDNVALSHQFGLAVPGNIRGTLGSNLSTQKAISKRHAVALLWGVQAQLEVAGIHDATIFLPRCCA